MSDSHVFEHDGYPVHYSPASVRTELRRFRYLSALITFYGYEDGKEASIADPEEWENYKQYSSGMSQCTTQAAWWVGSMSSPEDIAAAYELFMQEGADLYHKFVNANETTLPPKKTVTPVPTT